jgi:hypothetical protein
LVIYRFHSADFTLNLGIWVSPHHFPAVKFPLYLTKNLLGGQPSPMLWHWPVSLLSQKELQIFFKKSRAKNHSTSTTELVMVGVYEK